MDTAHVPPDLRERLGEGATGGLVQLLNDTKAEWAAEMIQIVGDRFERRLVEEVSRLRVEMAHEFASVRQEMAQGLAAVRQEMAEGLAAVRQEMAEGLASVRQEVAQGLAAMRVEMAQESALLRQAITRESALVRQEMAQQRVGLLKWAFLFWIGQFVAVAGLLALVIRLLRPGV